MTTVKKVERIFEINNAKADRFKEYCRDMHIPTLVEQKEGYKRFVCLMDEDELFIAKLFCEARCKPEPKKQQGNGNHNCNGNQKISVYIIIEETR